jgi:uncharacterized protein YlxW (UPF0749 family)
MEQNTNDILDSLAFIKNKVEQLPTKDDVREIVRDETKDIRTELTSIRRDLKTLADKVENMSGFSKEIDHALERIARIEKHLGLDKRVAA